MAQVLGTNFIQIAYSGISTDFFGLSIRVWQKVNGLKLSHSEIGSQIPGPGGTRVINRGSCAQADVSRSLCASNSAGDVEDNLLEVPTTTSNVWMCYMQVLYIQANKTDILYLLSRNFRSDQSNWVIKI